MNDEPTDHASLINALGGAAQVASFNAVSTLPVTVRAWSSRNRIPPEYWPGIIELAQSLGRGVSAEWLMRTTPARANRASSTPNTQAA